MKRLKLLSILILMFLPALLFGQYGADNKWIIVPDTTGVPKTLQDQYYYDSKFWVGNGTNLQQLSTGVAGAGFYVEIKDSTAANEGHYMTWKAGEDTASAHLTLIEARVEMKDSTTANEGHYATFKALDDTASAIRGDVPTNAEVVFEADSTTANEGHYATFKALEDTAGAHITLLDLRCLESVFGTSIGVGLTLDGAVLKAHASLQSIAGLTLTNGDMIYATGANAFAQLDHGTSGYLLTAGGVAAPSWAAPIWTQNDTSAYVTTSAKDIEAKLTGLATGFKTHASDDAYFNVSISDAAQGGADIFGLVGGTQETGDAGMRLIAASTDATPTDYLMEFVVGRLNGTTIGTWTGTKKAWVWKHSSLERATLNSIGSLALGGNVTDTVKPTFSLTGDADADGAESTSETITIGLTDNANPTLATWGFTTTQGAGYTFDKGVGVTGALTALKTTEQFRLSYDATNYMTVTISDDGLADFVTVDPDGAEADICFNPDGKVGIGTVTPEGTLHIRLATDDNIVFRSGGDMGESLMEAVNNANNAAVPFGIVGLPLVLNPGGTNLGLQYADPDHDFTLAKATPTGFCIVNTTTNVITTTQSEEADTAATVYNYDGVKTTSDLGRNSSGIMMSKTIFTKDSTSVFTVFDIPASAVVHSIWINITTGFTGSGTDLLDVGTTASITYFKDDLDVSGVAWTTTMDTNAPPIVPGATNITAQYIDQNSNAGAGVGEIYVKYSLH